MLFAWAIGNQPVQVWDCTTKAPMPEKLKSALEDPQVLTVWHNGGMFDTVILQRSMGINIPLDRVHDTLVQALAHGLPGSLNTLCEILNVPVDQAKDKAGKQLIQLFCKPRPKTSKIRRATSQTHPVEWQRFTEYAKSDIEAMRVIWKQMPRWNLNAFETRLWHLDQRINRRGICMDVELANAAIVAIDAEQSRLGGTDTHYDRR